MKAYLKMSDAFFGESFGVNSRLIVNDLDQECFKAISTQYATYAAHAINSHDELVDGFNSVTNERDELAKQVDILRSQLDDAFIYAFRSGCDTDSEIERGYAIDILKAYKKVKGL